MPHEGLVQQKTKGLALAVLIVLFAAGSAPAQEFAWIEKGWGGGGRYTAAAVNPADPAQVFIGSDVAGYYVSQDHGQSFKLRGAGLGGFAVAFICLDKDNPSTLLVLADDGLYLSADGGETVTKVSAKVRYNSRFFGSRLLVQHEGHWYAGTDTDGVFRVAPGGLNGSWTATALFGLQGKKVNSIAVFQGRLTAATDEGIFYHDGEIWKNFNEGLPPNRRNIVDMTAHPKGRLFAVEKNAGLYSFEERLGRWDRRSPSATALPSQQGPPSFKAVAVSPVNPDLLFLGSSPQSWPNLVLRSTDGGRNWTLVKRFALAGVHQNWAQDVESVEQIVFSPDGRVVYLMDWWNVWRSADEGQSWLQAHQGLQNTCINDIQAHPTKPGVLYVAADDNGLMVSQDDGRSWRRKMNGVIDGHASQIKLSSRNPDVMYLLMNPWKPEDAGDSRFFYLYKSVDGGESWKSLKFRDKKKNVDKPFANGRSTNLAIDPQNENVVYVGNNGYGIYKVDSTTMPEAGQEAKAQHLSATLPTPYLKGSGALQVDPSNPQIMIAGTQEGGIFRTEDGGKSWKLAGAPKAFIFGMARDPQNPAVLYAAASEKRLYKSVDNGLTWQLITLPGEKLQNGAASAVAVVPGEAGKPGAVVVGTLGYSLKAGDGVFISQDGGQSFVQGPKTLPRVGVNVLTPYTRGGGLVLAGFNGLGVYQLTGKGK
jgi:photosystem II stability/assembly factor-like uncharacterized protein